MPSHDPQPGTAVVGYISDTEAAPSCLNVVCDGVGGHIEEEEVLLLRGEHALLYQVLGQPLTHVLQLVPNNSHVVSMHAQSGITASQVRDTYFAEVH